MLDKRSHVLFLFMCELMFSSSFGIVIKFPEARDMTRFSLDH